MDLKFTFGGASPDHHDHGDAPSGIPLPFSTVTSGSLSSQLEVHARLTESEVIAEAVSGDGVTYASGEAAIRGEGSLALAQAVRSALSRAVAGLEGPLAESVSAVQLSLGGVELDVLAALGLPAVEGTAASVDDALQRRVGISAGTPIRITS